MLCGGGSGRGIKGVLGDPIAVAGLNHIPKHPATQQPKSHRSLLILPLHGSVLSSVLVVLSCPRGSVLPSVLVCFPVVTTVAFGIN